MRHALQSLCMTVGLTAVVALPAVAQQSTVMDDLLRDIAQVEEKLIGLAQAIPADRYDWRPAEGVRSVREVFLHVAAENYFLPTAFGATPPAATGVTAGDYAGVQAYEARALSPDETVAELERSFAFLKQAMRETAAAQLRDSVSMFGMTFSGQQLWVLTATHMHEHLGQQIAYARTNGVVPPWSRGGM